MVIGTDCTGSCKSGFSKYYPLLEVYKFRVVNLKKVFFFLRGQLYYSRKLEYQMKITDLLVLHYAKSYMDWIDLMIGV